MLYTIIIVVAILILSYITGFTSLYIKQCKKCITEFKKLKNTYNFTRDIKNLPDFWRSKLHLQKWNDHSWDVSTLIHSLSYKDIIEDPYLKMALFSEPLLMYMKRNDENFVRELKQELTDEQLLESIQKLRNAQDVQYLERAEMLNKLREEFYGN